MIMKPKSMVAREHGSTRLDSNFPGKRSDKEIQKATAIKTAPQRIEVPSPIMGLISDRMEMCRIVQNKMAGTNTALRTMVPPESMISRPEMASACKNKGTKLKRNDCKAMILIIPTMRWVARMVNARNTAKIQLTSIQDIIPYALHKVTMRPKKANANEINNKSRTRFSRRRAMVDSTIPMRTASPNIAPKKIAISVQ